MYDPDLHAYKACCLYGLCHYKEAKEEAEKAEEGGLKTRLMFHLAQKLSDEKTLMIYHEKLSDSVPDQLCLAALHCKIPKILF